MDIQTTPPTAEERRTVHRIQLLRHWGTDADLRAAAGLERVLNNTRRVMGQPPVNTSDRAMAWPLVVKATHNG